MKENSNFDNSTTKINLARAFAGECMDGARYQFIARQAESEGFQHLKSLLKTLAKNEMAHAKMFFDLIVEHSTVKQKNIEIQAGYPFRFGTLLENLEYSIDVEVAESENIYPAFAKVAKDEGFGEVAKKFEFAASVENCHNMLLTQIKDKMENKTIYKSPTPIKWKCSNCGFEHTCKTPWDICPSCNAEKGYIEIPVEVGK